MIERSSEAAVTLHRSILMCGFYNGRHSAVTTIVGIDSPDRRLQNPAAMLPEENHRLFKTMISKIAAVALCFFSGQLAVAKEVSPQITGAPDALDSFIVERMDKAGIIGLGAAIIVDKKVAWMKG